MKLKTFTAALGLFLISGIPSLNAKSFDWIEVRVNSKIITHNEIELKTFEMARTQKISRKEDFLTLRDQVIEQLIDEALLDSQADELGITLSDDELNDEVDYFRKQRKLSPTEFEELLEAKQTNLAEFKRSFSRQIIRNRVIAQEVKAMIRISDEELKKRYDKAESTKSKIKARHILRRIPSGASKSEINKVKEKVIWIKNQIKSGQSFTKMADSYSEDPSVKSNHGDLGFFGREDMVKAFSDAAFSLPLNTVSEPIKSIFGYHLIEVTEKKKVAKEPFPKVKNKLYQQVFQENYPKKLKDYLKKLRSTAKISKK